MQSRSRLSYGLYLTSDYGPDHWADKNYSHATNKEKREAALVVAAQGMTVDELRMILLMLDIKPDDLREE